MKLLRILLISVFCLSFCPSTEKVNNNSRSGFFISVEDFTNRTYREYIVDSKDSVDIIFSKFFNSELQLGVVNNPITIYNRKHNFYVARVIVYETPNGKKKFKNLKYSDVFIKRSKLRPVIF